MAFLVVLSLFSLLASVAHCQTQCTPTITPFTWANANSWPLVNGTVAEPTGHGIAQVNTSIAAVQSYIARKHNCLRAKQPASDMLQMSWNAAAAAKAQAWANGCTYAHSTALQRKTAQFECGQNIAMNTGTAPYSWNRIANLWYNEVNQYVYGAANTGPAVVGHYTQIVWAKSWQVGCGYKKCGTGTSTFHFYVCNYCPPGNVNGYATPYTKGTACAKCPGACSGGKLCTNTCGYSNVYSNCDSLKASNPTMCSAAVGTSLYTLAQSCKASCLCVGKIY